MQFSFGPKLYFPYFFIPDLKEERESNRIPVIKRESLG
jgi:hypothetical protein